MNGGFNQNFLTAAKNKVFGTKHKEFVLWEKDWVKVSKTFLWNMERGGKQPGLDFLPLYQNKKETLVIRENQDHDSYTQNDA